MAVLAPSIIAADFTNLAAQLDVVAPFTTRWHVDVMDGHFVPNLTIGPMIVEAIARTSRLPQDVHLMITNPDETWEWYAKAGASRIAFHPDAAKDTGALLQTLADAGIGPGLAVNPEVSPDSVKPYLDAVDHLVVMSVHPGFSGQEFLPEALPKLRTFREWIGESAVDLVIDGGVSPKTAPECVEAGADILVSASAVFGAVDPAAVAQELVEIGNRA
jgi:ribulose-phosphate 3-epimerase